MATVHLRGLLRQLKSRLGADSTFAHTDQQLLAQLRESKNEPAFVAVLERHGPMVYRVCLRVLNREVDAEDAFQATFTVLVEKAHTIHTHGSLATIATLVVASHGKAVALAGTAKATLA